LKTEFLGGGFWSLSKPPPQSPLDFSLPPSFSLENFSLTIFSGLKVMDGICAGLRDDGFFEILVLEV